MWFWIIFLAGSCLTVGTQGAPRRKYLCPPDFVRHGNSCYFFSTHMATWFEAHFHCKDLGAELAILEKGWEDRNMRTYLNKPELTRVERWIGGIYNWETKRWVWGANGGHPLKYQGFSRMSRDKDPRWNCIIMDPSMRYKWGSRGCIDKKHYICEVPLKKMQLTNSDVKPRKPKKPRDPNKPKKPRDPNKKPRDPNKPRKNRQGRRQRQQMRQQQRFNTKQMVPVTHHDNQALLRQHDNQALPRQHDNQALPRQHDNQALPRQHDNQALPRQHDANPYNNHAAWNSANRYRYLQIQPELIPYKAEVLI